MISIVTVSYNAEKCIERTICSILEQEYFEYEYIIVDGASKDSTNDIIQKYIKLFNEKGIVVKYISEPDDGIYDAMNKAINIAEGDWINFMNAGDMFCSKSTLKNVSPYLKNDIGVLYGKVVLVSDSYYNCLSTGNINNIINGTPFNHQSSFTRTDLMKKYGFDTIYKICADYDFFCKCYISDVVFEKIEIEIANFAVDGISSINTKLLFEESLVIQKKYFNLSRSSIFFRRLKYFRAWIGKMGKIVIKCISKEIYEKIEYSEKFGWKKCSIK